MYMSWKIKNNSGVINNNVYLVFTTIQCMKLMEENMKWRFTLTSAEKSIDKVIFLKFFEIKMIYPYFRIFLWIT